MLMQHLDGRAPESLFVSSADYRPFPALHERKAWEGLPEHIKDGLQRDGEDALSYTWPTLPATRYLDYKRDGNRTRFQQLYFERRKKLVKLVLAECVENRGRFIDAIVNGIWAVCEESCWMLPAHLYLSPRAKDDGLPDVSEHAIDLMAAETGGLLAAVYYLLRDSLDTVSPAICKRIRHELRQRIVYPYVTRNDFFWLGLVSNQPVNNWNPWVNSCCLFSILLVEDDPAIRSKAIVKIIRSLDRFLQSYAADGGCDEGPAYWDRAGGALFDCLHMLYEASNGRFDVSDEPLIRQIGLYICRVFIDGDCYVNFADAEPRLSIDGSVLYRFGLRLNDPQMIGLGKHAMAYMRERDTLSLHRVVPMLFQLDEMQQTESTAPYIRDVWLQHIELMTAREHEGSAAGFFLAAKGGHNGENHNHNDVGQFVVYYNGLPVLIDPGAETYSARTFGPQRYEIWTMRSAYHNLPVINHCEQQNGRSFTATEVVYEANDFMAELSMSLAKAYPAAAGLIDWRRSCRLQRGAVSSVVIMDMIKLQVSTSDIHMNLMTPHEPWIVSENRLVLKLPDGTWIEVELKLNGNAQIRIDNIPLSDEKMRRAWGEQLYRIVISPKLPLCSAKWMYMIRTCR